jgi:MFS family permease
MITYTKIRKVFHGKQNVLLSLSLVLSIGFALIDTVWAVFLYDILKSESLVGIVQGCATIVSLLLLIFIVPIIEKFDTTKILIGSFIGVIVSTLLFGLYTSIYVLIAAYLLGIISGVFRIDSFWIFVRDTTTLKNIAKTEGVVMTAMYIGWVIGPLIAGYFAFKYGNQSVFLLSALFLTLALLVLIFSGIKSKPRIIKKLDIDAIKNLKDFFQKRELTLHYFVSGGTSLWWGLVFIFVPLFILEQGMTIKEISWFLIAAMIPPIFLNYLFGKMADKYGYNKIFVAGYIFLTATLITAFLISNPISVLIVLAIGSVGIAMIEPTSEAAFFHIVPKKNEEKYYSIYSTTNDLFFILASFGIAAILFFTNFNYMLLILAGVQIMLAVAAWKLSPIFTKKGKNKLKYHGK